MNADWWSEFEFDEFMQYLHESLFHVQSTDINSETGAKCEEQILVELLAAYPQALRFKSLSEWCEYVCGKC